MANLYLIKRLNENYGKNSSLTRETRLFSINEALYPNNIQKAITDSIADLGTVFTMYFDLGLPADVVDDKRKHQKRLWAYIEANKKR